MKQTRQATAILGAGQPFGALEELIDRLADQEHVPAQAEVLFDQVPEGLLIRCRW